MWTFLFCMRFVSFRGLKIEAYTCLLSLFRTDFAPFHCFTVLVSTRDFKSASLELGPWGLRVLKNELCYVCTVLVSTHGFKNQLCVLCSVLGSTHGFKNEFCCLLGLPVST